MPGRRAGSTSSRRFGGQARGINSESDVTANLQIGPTDLGMVRIYISGDGIDLPMDFDPDEAGEIADEIRAAAEAARSVKPKKKKSR